MRQFINTRLNYPGVANLNFTKSHLSTSRFQYSSKSEADTLRLNQLLTSETLNKISTGNFPDLTDVCSELVSSFRINNYPFKATQFLEVLRTFELSAESSNLILNHPEKKHVLMQNELIKVVLIHWNPNDFAPIHGHAVGGCVLKVLKGKIFEKRFSPDGKQNLLSRSELTSGAMAYIDDSMAYHSVINCYPQSAISLHVYTPGMR